MQLYALRLKPGQDLKAELRALVAREQIQAGWILTAVGSLTTYCLRFANQEKGNQGQGHFEILSLVGTLSQDGLHLHMSLGDHQGHTRGGHLLDGNLVYTTAEIVVGASHEMVFSRAYDGSTPYPELQIRPGQTQK